MHEFVKNTYLGTLNNFNTAIVAGKFPASGSFISAQPYPWFVFLIKVGTLDSAITVQLQRDTGATQTADVEDVTGAVVSIAADDDNELFYIEVETRAALLVTAATVFTHFTLNVTGAAGGNDYLDMFYFGCHGKSKPITQGSNISGVVIAG